MRRRMLVLALFVSSFCVTACDDELRDRWVQALNECGVTDVIPSTVLYFGPSSNVGPGSGWRETFDQKGRHIDYRLKVDNQELPDPKPFIRLSPSGYECKGSRELTFKLNISIAVHASTLPLSAELSKDLQWAREITVTVSGMGWDELNEADYEEYLRKTLGVGNRYYEEMNGPDRLVLRRALAVKNLLMAYWFSSGDAAWLKRKYKGPLGGQGSGDIGAGLSADWHESNVLTIMAANAWVLGELVPFKSSTGFITTRSQAGRTAVKIVPDSAIVAENENRLVPPQ
jgi:hypothetical protein